MKTLGLSPGGTVKTLYMPLSDLGAEGPEIPQLLRRLIEALFHCFPGQFALGRPYGAKTKLYQMLAGLTLIRNPGIRLRSPKESNP